MAQRGETGAERGAPHPYRLAIEARDADAVLKSLHPDVSFCPAPFAEPIQGRDNVLAFLAVLATVFEKPEITDELWGDASYAFTFRDRVEGYDVEVVDHLQLDAGGLVTRITTTARPLASLRLLAGKLADAHAELSGAARGKP